MHVAILTFNLGTVTKEQFLATCDELAPKLAATPGLVSKVWLADPSANTYGGVYTFRDRAAFDAFARSDFAKGLASNPTVSGMVMRDYSVLEGPTRVTRGLPASAAVA